MQCDIGPTHMFSILLFKKINLILIIIILTLSNWTKQKVVQEELLI